MYGGTSNFCFQSGYNNFFSWSGKLKKAMWKTRKIMNSYHVVGQFSWSMIILVIGRGPRLESSLREKLLIYQTLFQMKYATAQSGYRQLSIVSSR